MHEIIILIGIPSFNIRILYFYLGDDYISLKQAKHYEVMYEKR